MTLHADAGKYDDPATPAARATARLGLRIPPGGKIHR